MNADRPLPPDVIARARARIAHIRKAANAPRLTEFLRLLPYLGEVRWKGLSFERWMTAIDLDPLLYYKKSEVRGRGWVWSFTDEGPWEPQKGKLKGEQAIRAGLLALADKEEKALEAMEHWRCPSCGGLEISLYDLSKEHGWDPLYDEQPEEGWCYRQVEKNTIACCNGVEAWHNHEYQTVWTEAAGYLPGYAEAHAKGAPLELTGVVWRKVVAIVDGYPCIRHERGTT